MATLNFFPPWERPREFSDLFCSREFYLQLSPAHKKYEVQGTSLTSDTVIDVWEEAGKRLVVRLQFEFTCPYLPLPPTIGTTLSQLTMWYKFK
ncbi:MAG: hypothetical protein BM485_02190 [Desulfobulbaceae bacterium DB1]|nr:MAG: hypothetical protein BM485_02190 [Desulfobulbaceae bacterium DB1]